MILHMFKNKIRIMFILISIYRDLKLLYNEKYSQNSDKDPSN